MLQIELHIWDGYQMAPPLLSKRETPFAAAFI
jgi:hypothetical protein